MSQCLLCVGEAHQDLDRGWIGLRTGHRRRFCVLPKHSNDLIFASYVFGGANLTWDHKQTYCKCKAKKSLYSVLECPTYPYFGMWGSGVAESKCLTVLLQDLSRSSMSMILALYLYNIYIYSYSVKHDPVQTSHGFLPRIFSHKTPALPPVRPLTRGPNIVIQSDCPTV